MRAFPLLVTVLSAAVMAGCADGPEHVAGAAEPAGAAIPAVTASRPAPLTTSPVASPAVSASTITHKASFATPTGPT